MLPSCMRLHESRRNSAKIEAWVRSEISPGMTLSDVKHSLDTQGIGYNPLSERLNDPDGVQFRLSVSTDYEITRLSRWAYAAGIELPPAHGVNPWVHVYFDGAQVVVYLD